MLQDVADDERQIFLSHNLLLVTQLRDALRHFSGLFWCQFQPQFLQILGNIRLSAVLAERILPSASEPLRHKFILIEIILLITIGMNTRYLREDIVADNRLIGCHSDAAITLYESRDIVEFVLIDIRLRMELILENHLNT